MKGDIIKKYKKKEENIDIKDSLEDFLIFSSNENPKFTKEQILEFLFKTRNLEKKGIIKDLKIKFLKQKITITWDDKDLGKPIGIKVKDDITMKEIIQKYKEIL